MELFLELHIDLLVQACELTDAQVKKLRFLGKGVVTRKLASGSAQLKKFMIDSDLTPDEAPPNLPGKIAYKLMVSGARIDQELEGVVRFRTRCEQPLFDHPLWLGFLKSNLSETQFSNYEIFNRQRNERFIDSAIDLAIVELDGGILLSPAQRDKIKEIWRSKLLAKATSSFPVNLEEASVMAKSILDDRAMIESTLTNHQRQALKSRDALTNWDGVGWNGR